MLSTQNGVLGCNCFVCSCFCLTSKTFCRKMEQLVLYVKALRALNLSLLFAQGEIRIGHLKPSNAVKNGKV